MRLYVPYTEIQPATAISLLGYPYIPVKIEGPDGYRDYWQERWTERQTFLSVEHDVVVWPGGLEQLDECPHDWCAYGYSLADDFADHARSAFPYLGAVKFSAGLIAATPDAWDHDDWRTLDRHIARVLRASGREVCQHFPGVVNANPVRLEGIRCTSKSLA